MFLTFKDRPSSSPFVERVWSTNSRTGGAFYSMAEGGLELVVTRLEGLCRVTLRGPVTKASPVDCPANGEWLAIRFGMGTFFTGQPTATLMDHHDIDFPTIRGSAFWFAGAAWEVPTYENAEAFVHKLARIGAIATDPFVSAAIEGDPQVLSQRSVQRRFLRVTGMTHTLFRQIQRARYAAKLLTTGSSALDVVHAARYFDQAHLSRSLRRLVGPTPATILRKDVQLSFSHSAEPVPGA